ncbi:MAG: hypothetical protein VCE43_13545, partial [Myxococcota bacterium]
MNPLVSRMLLAPAILLVLAAPLRGDDVPCPPVIPVILLYDENEEVSEKNTDANKDCKFDEFVYYV